mgnify:FL=1
MISYKQKKWNHFRNFELLDEGVKYEYKVEEGYFSQTLKFETIGFDEQISDKKPSSVKVGLVLSILFNIILFFLAFGNKFIDMDSPMSPTILLILAIVPLIIFKSSLQREHLKFIVGQQNLCFWYDKKYQADVDNFIAEIKDAKRKYMRKKYLVLNDYDEASAFKHRLNWLLVEKFIDESEHKEWLQKLENRKIIRGE